MKYYVYLEAPGGIIYRESFEGNIPIINRRKAYKALNERVSFVKDHVKKSLDSFNLYYAADYALEQTNEVLTYALGFYLYDEPVPIESSGMPEGHLLMAKHLECKTYLEQGYNTAGNPCTKYYSSTGEILTILKDNIKED